MRRIAAMASVIGAAVLFTATVQAAGEVRANLASGEKIFKEGKGSVPACNSCHGEKGMGNDMMGTPRLAGQMSQFVVKQLEDFATDKRIDSTMFVMNANAKGLAEQDRRDVAAYVSSLGEEMPAADRSNLAELKAAGTVVGETHLGKEIVQYGIVAKGVPACMSCHGYNGRGVDPIYPKLNGQKYVYLVNQLNKWRDGSRANDPLAQMRKVAAQLSDADIANVAAYLAANAENTTIGNSRTPEQHPYMLFDRTSSFH
ncbi:MAG: c-type cytochrome [Gammaproteobacteria bacterium]|nr:c-type cytochrome [Gammaproteobacteria bacterium]